MIRNQAGQSIGAQLINATTGAAFAGSVSVYVTGDAGAQVLGSVGAGVCTLEGNGYYTYRPSADETNFALAAFTFIGSGAVPVTIQVPTVSASQSSALQTATGSQAISVVDLITDALAEICVVSGGDPAAGDDAARALRICNRILDRWNAKPSAAYVSALASYTLVPALQPHTIGPNTATWAVAQRPTMLQGAELVVNNLGQPINVRDAKWWLRQTDKTRTSTFPTDVYFESAWPNANLYFWPVPTTAYRVNLLLSGLLGPFALTDTVWMPSGYLDALVLTLAESCAASFGVEVPSIVTFNARDARDTAFSLNAPRPTLRTRDSGLGRSSRRGVRDIRVDGWPT